MRRILVAACLLLASTAAEARHRHCGHSHRCQAQPVVQAPVVQAPVVQAPVCKPSIPQPMPGPGHTFVTPVRVFLAEHGCCGKRCGK